MRKSTLFVSAMLTVFLMATIFGVVSAYQQVVKNSSGSSGQPKSEPVKVEAMPAPTEIVQTAPHVVTAEEATTIAMDFLGDSNVYSVEVVDYQDAPTYLVTFSSGDLVYVSSMGSVVTNTKLEPVVVVASNGGNGGGHGGGNGGNGGDDGGGGQSSAGNPSGGENHEDGEDHHEDHEEHDD